MVTQEAAKIIREGHMKVFLDTDGTLMIETITRTRRTLWIMDPYARLVFFAIDPDGRLVTELGG